MLFTKKKGMAYETAGLTDKGLVRENNEDNIFVLDIKEPGRLWQESCGIYVIADGMGGHQAGEVASDMAIKIISGVLKEGFGETSDLTPELLIQQAMEKANDEIFTAAGSKPELHSMGTTVTLGLRLDDTLYIGHVGDSRAYLIRNKKLRQLTEDHSLVARLVKDGMIST